MPKMVGSVTGKEDRRILEGQLKVFMEEMRKTLSKMIKRGHAFEMKEMTSDKILRARKDLLEYSRTLYSQKDMEVEVAIKAMEVWYRRVELDKLRTVENEEE